jgi:Icc-related predicted phosphoesterase
MKITVVSDLHMEFSPITLTNSQEADVLILSGDILMSEILHDYPADSTEQIYNTSRQLKAWRFREFLKECSDEFKHVIYVAGNHEFYQGKFHAGLEYLKDECSRYPNVHFLENASVTIDDIIFIGATLWTDAHKGDPLTMYQLPFMMNDYALIKNDHKGYRKLHMVDTIDRHHTSMDYIEMMVENAPSDKKIVIATHHSPSYLSIVDKYADQYEMNGGYHSDLSKFILDNPNIALWVHGHTHEVLDYKLGETRIVCNPRGYEGDSYHENTGWNPNILLEV